MIDLREGLQELADAGARHGTTPGPAAAIRRGRQRRRRIVGTIAAVIALALAVGNGATARLADLSDLPATTPSTLPPMPPLDLRSGLPTGPAETAAFRTLERRVRRCRGGVLEQPQVVGYFRSAEFRRLVMVVAKLPSVGEGTICWAGGVFGLDGAGALPGPVRPASIATGLGAQVSRSAGYGWVRGLVDRRSFRVRVRFRDRPDLLDVPVIHGSHTYLVNFYVGLFPPGWVPVEVTAFDAEGRQLAGCAVDPSASALPRCPGS
jgi:hypothetical protein